MRSSEVARERDPAVRPSRREVRRPSPSFDVDPGMITPRSLLGLQRSGGNRAVSQLIKEHSRPSPVKVQRLSFDRTRWEDANRAKVSDDGGSGVIFVDDGAGPLVVKPRESFTIEAEIAAKMLRGATATPSGKWSAGAPEARPVGDAEAARIHAKVSDLLQPELSQTPPPRRMVGLVDGLKESGSVTVYGFAKGEAMESSIVKNKQTGKTGFLGMKRGLREGTVSHQLMNDPGLLTMLGRAGAADIFLGNGDRIFGKINFGNILLDNAANRLSMIDNVELGSFSLLRDMPDLDETAQKGFKKWTQWGARPQAAADQFEGVAANFLSALDDWILVGGGEGGVRQKDVKPLRKALLKRRPQMSAWMTTGLREGMLGIRRGLLDSALSMTAHIDPAKREQVVTSLLARGSFREGLSADAAWKEATEMAHLMVGITRMPTLPKLPTPV